MKTYQERIAEIVGPSVDPRHVEAWMRIEHGTLDQLSASAFVCDVMVAMRCISAAGVEQSEELARSYGL